MGRRNLSSISTHSLYESKISLEVMSYTLFIGISMYEYETVTYFSLSEKSLHQNMWFMRN